MPRLALGVSAAALAGALAGRLWPRRPRPSAPRPANTPRNRARASSCIRAAISGPNAKRHCHFWLAKEYRASGPVITPQMRCWWR